MTRTIVGFSIKVLAFVLIPLNVLAIDVYSGDNTFTGWEGKGKSNPFKNMSTSAAKRNTPIVSEADLIKKGKDYLFQAEYYDAIKTFNNVLKINKKNSEAYKGIGLACYHLGNNEQYSDPEKLSRALNAFKQSLAIKQDAEIYYVLGELYLYLDNKSAALQTYEILRNLDEEKAKLLASQIDAYKEPQNYELISTTTVITRKAYVDDQEPTEQQVERDRLITVVEEARQAAKNAENRAKDAEKAAVEAQKRARQLSSASSDSEYENRRLRHENIQLESDKNRMRSFGW